LKLHQRISFRLLISSGTILVVQRLHQAQQVFLLLVVVNQFQNGPLGKFSSLSLISANGVSLHLPSFGQVQGVGWELFFY
jgi:hypothetical protein